MTECSMKTEYSNTYGFYVLCSQLHLWTGVLWHSSNQFSVSWLQLDLVIFCPKSRSALILFCTLTKGHSWRGSLFSVNNNNPSLRLIFVFQLSQFSGTIEVVYTTLGQTLIGLNKALTIITRIWTIFYYYLIILDCNKLFFQNRGHIPSPNTNKILVSCFGFWLDYRFISNSSKHRHHTNTESIFIL